MALLKSLLFKFLSVIFSIFHQLFLINMHRYPMH
nr:MAG TPA: hypothetical protein [Caudoviricetes sp.]